MHAASEMDLIKGQLSPPGIHFSIVPSTNVKVTHLKLISNKVNANT